MLGLVRSTQCPSIVARRSVQLCRSPPFYCTPVPPPPAQRGPGSPTPVMPHSSLPHLRPAPWPQ